MDEKNKVAYKLVASSSPDVLIPAMFQNLCHIYAHGDKEHAIESVQHYFVGLITYEGARRVLDGTKLPIWDMTDLDSNSLSYMFEEHELTEEAKKGLGLD